jgi:hypothetical protein
VYYKKAAGENLLSTHQKRVIFFSNEVEAEQFINLVNEVMQQAGGSTLPASASPMVNELQEPVIPGKFYNKEQVKEALVQLVQSDKFVDQFYNLLVKKYGKVQDSESDS